MECLRPIHLITAAKVGQQTFHKVSRPKSRRRVVVPLRRKSLACPSWVFVWHRALSFDSLAAWLRHGERRDVSRYGVRIFFFFFIFFFRLTKNYLSCVPEHILRTRTPYTSNTRTIGIRGSTPHQLDASKSNRVLGSAETCLTWCYRVRDWPTGRQWSIRTCGVRGARCAPLNPFCIPLSHGPPPIPWCPQTLSLSEGKAR